MTTEKKSTFEEALRKLEAASENLKRDNVSLEDALKYYEEGIAFYNECSDILNNAKQKIETYSKL